MRHVSFSTLQQQDQTGWNLTDRSEIISVISLVLRPFLRLIITFTASLLSPIDWFCKLYHVNDVSFTTQSLFSFICCGKQKMQEPDDLSSCDFLSFAKSNFQNGEICQFSRVPLTSSLLHCNNIDDRKVTISTCNAYQSLVPFWSNRSLGRI